MAKKGISAKKPRRIIAVIGGRRASKAHLKEALAAGRLIARSGAVLMTGGLSGVMEAACKGAHLEGGLTIGILPGTDKHEANKYVDIPVVTGLGIGRNVIIARAADALIAIGGQYGTLSEIAFALQLNKPVAGIGTWSIEGVMQAKDAHEAIEKALDSLDRA